MTVRQLKLEALVVAGGGAVAAFASPPEGGDTQLPCDL
jgi:hypothetical protein